MFVFKVVVPNLKGTVTHFVLCNTRHSEMEHDGPSCAGEVSFRSFHARNFWPLLAPEGSLNYFCFRNK